MKTALKTAHEEEYGEADKRRTLGVLLNYSVEDGSRVDSFVYIFNHKSVRYTFFNSIVEMIDSHFYGDEKVKRAYMDEAIFDEYYDAPFIVGAFKEKLVWI
jgi:hypothetical protein